MTSRKDEMKNKEIPPIVTDEKTGKKYEKGRFLGKGGFARCYELIDMKSKEVYAGKIVCKSLLVKQHQKEKMAQEIEIHRQLNSQHIVGFHSFFEDSDFVYILLELCRRRSLMELHKRRKAITEPEARYFFRQTVLGCLYLHKERKVIHRDLKLGNLFLNDNMEIKLGDFGLATRVGFDGERKRTLCGTPNYIAPEVLCKKGHSFEVDIWSLGCILYTLLVGKPPFETSCLKDTYSKIRKNDYNIPIRVSAQAKKLIERMLQADPSLRPSCEQVLRHEFFDSGLLPQVLPTSCLTTAPRFDTLYQYAKDSRKPLSELNSRRDPSGSLKSETDRLRKLDVCAEDAAAEIIRKDPEEPEDYYLGEMFKLVSRVVRSKPSEKANICEEDAEDPAAVPIYWVSKWVDYSDKYGLGYQLSDNSIGVLFNDNTRLLLSNGENIQYIERDFTEHLHTLKMYPENLMKKVTLLKYFRNYMSEHLLKAGANMTPREGDEMTRLPFLRTWFRTRSAIVLHLSNGTLQINFFQDHTKIILCPLMGAVSYIDEKRNFKTYRLSQVETFGCSKEVACRMRYTLAMIERLMTSFAKSGSAQQNGVTTAAALPTGPRKPVSKIKPSS